MHVNTFFLSVACLFAFLIKFIRWAEVLMMSANLPKWFLMVVTFFDFLANSSPTPKSLSYSLWFSSRALWFSFLWWGLDLAWYNFYVGCEVGIEILPPPLQIHLFPHHFLTKFPFELLWYLCWKIFELYMFGLFLEALFGSLDLFLPIL